MFTGKRRKFFADEDSQNAAAPPTERFSLLEHHTHTEGMRKAHAAPHKTHVDGDTMFVARGFQARNEEGLRRAYASSDKTFVDGDTEYVAGTDPTDYRDFLLTP